MEYVVDISWSEMIDVIGGNTVLKL